MKLTSVEQRRMSAWPAWRTLGNYVALPLAILLALAAARNDVSNSSTAGSAGDAASLPVELERIGEALTPERPFPPALVDDLNRWIEPMEPMKIAGPIYYVGTHGLGAYLITTPAGHILVDGGMPSSAKTIEASIRRLGFMPEDIRFLLITHAHIDHAGTLAYFKRMSDATVAVMARDFESLKSGGRTDPIYGADSAFYFPPVKADRVLKDGDTVSVGNVSMTARLTAGHTQGCTTWVMTVTDGGTPYTVVFPGSSNVNPGTRLGVNPSYPGIASDFRHTFVILDSLKPDIWLAAHSETFGFDDKRAAANDRGVAAWVDPAGYKRYVAESKAAFDTLAAESLQH
jgi:metallo-beta-lactamase class B